MNKLNIITDAEQIYQLIAIASKPAMMGVAEADFGSLNMIHCVAVFVFRDLDELEEIKKEIIDQSLIDNTSKVLIAVESYLDISKYFMERIANVVSYMTNSIPYRMSWHAQTEDDDGTTMVVVFFIE
ncbi:hypothetical protein JV173_03645 [Acholeplasma equirhinis]|uniref:hypothetical protein n=1 Tax=Acholeplasma equirhinis TaxID=555393 RepID=UPI00197AE6C2|nr:hypothetical protein [Acholeplasma equirhinis]MBN3490603.1 hypothetical protein [Acholeplasma equirhinis]